MPKISRAISIRAGDRISSSNRDILTAAKGGGIIFVGSLVNYASRFAFGIIVARAIGAADFGLYNLAVSMGLLLVGVSMMGLPSGIVRFLPMALRKREETFVWGILQTALALVGVISIGLGLIVFGFADLLAQNVFHEPTLAPLLRIVSVSIPLAALGRILMAATQGFKQMQYQVYADDVVFNLAKLGLTVLLLGAGFGVAGAVTAHVSAWVIEVLLLIYFLNHLFSLRRPLRTAQRNTRELMSFSFPIYLSSLVNKFSNNLDIMILGILGSAAWVGVYNAALRVQIIGVMFLSAVQTAASPIISDLHHRGQNAQLEQLYQTLTKWSLAFTLPFFLTVALFSKPILSIFGEEFETGSLALIILAVGTLVNGGTGTCGPMITMTGYSRLKLVNSIGSTVIMLGLDWLLIPRWGILGAAAATGLAVAILNIVVTIEVYVLLKLWPYTLSAIKPVVGGIAAFLATFFLNQITPSETHWVSLVLKISFLWLSYVAAVILLGLSEEDKIVLDRIQKRLGMRLLGR